MTTYAAASVSNGRCRFVNPLSAVDVYGTALGEAGDGYLVCVAPPAPSGRASVLVSLNGVNYDGPADGGQWTIDYYSAVTMGELLPPGGPVAGGSLIRVRGSNLDAYGQTFPPGQASKFITVTALGILSGGGYVVDGIARAELNLTRGSTYTLQVVALDNALAITTSSIGGADAVADLIGTGLTVNPVEYGKITFLPDASLPPVLYYQSTQTSWTSSDARLQRIQLHEPSGVSLLRFGSSSAYAYGRIRARNNSMLEVVAPPATAAGRVSVVFSPNGATENYDPPLNYTYHEEPYLSQAIT